MACIWRTQLPFTWCATVAGWLGVCQAIVMIVVSILCIEVVTREREEKFNQWHVLHPHNFTNLRWGIFYVDFLVDGYGRGTTLFYFMIAYVPISIFWFIASVLVICVSSGALNRNRGCTFFAYGFWSGMTYLVCLMDLIMVITLVRYELLYYTRPINIPSRPTQQNSSELSSVPDETTTTGVPGYLWGRRFTPDESPEIEQVWLDYVPSSLLDRERGVLERQGTWPTTEESTEVEGAPSEEVGVPIGPPIIAPAAPTPPAIMLHPIRRLGRLASTSTTMTTTTRHPSTFMRWDHTLLYDHDQILDMQRAFVFRSLMVAILKGLFLWVINFILATHLIASPFGTRNDCLKFIDFCDKGPFDQMCC